MNSWKLKDELLLSLNKWYLIVVFILAGSAIGLGISYFLPAPYRATKDIYVGIDVVRVNEMEYIISFSKYEPLNLDDYKNWQLKQVADILKSELILNETLRRLEQENSIWHDYDLDEFRKSIDIYWYDAGVWRHEVTMQDKELAAMAVTTWLETGHDKITNLLAISREGFDIDQQIWSTNLAISSLKRDRAKFRTFSSSSIEWVSVLSEKDPGSFLDDETIKDLSEWSFIYLDDSHRWNTVFIDIPNEDQPVDDYLEWFVGVEQLVELALEEIEKEITLLSSELEELRPEYHDHLENSMGLSVNLVLLPDSSKTEITQVYSVDKAILGGAFLGLLAWMVWFFIRLKAYEEIDD